MNGQWPMRTAADERRGGHLALGEPSWHRASAGFLAAPAIRRALAERFPAHVDAGASRRSSTGAAVTRERNALTAPGIRPKESPCHPSDAVIALRRNHSNRRAPKTIRRAG